MIISASTRTDIVAFYMPWLLNRFNAGYVCARNPLFPGKVAQYELHPDKVDALVFHSKNFAPFLPHALQIVRDWRTLFHYTITPYGKEIEPNTPSIDESIEIFKCLSSIAGAKRMVWRYDPVLLTKFYSVERHFERFEKIARALQNRVAYCVFTFVDMHIGLKTAMPELLPFREGQKRELAAGFGRIAARYGIPIQTCTDEADYSSCGVRRAGCTTLDALAAANKCEFRETRHEGNRRGCSCITSRDIGSYETCTGGCLYCSANTDPELIKRNVAEHDPDSPLLTGTLQSSDSLIPGRQTSFLRNDGRQISLFDGF